MRKGISITKQTFELVGDEKEQKLDETKTTMINWLRDIESELYSLADEIVLAEDFETLEEIWFKIWDLT